MQFEVGDLFFVEFIAGLERHKVRYMLIGGMAVCFHGFVRNTQDMDIWLAPTNENRDLFYKVLLDVGYEEDEIAQYRDEDFTTFFKCSIGDVPNSIDCLTFVHPSISFDDAEKEVIRHNIGNDVFVNIVDYDFLRKMKILTHREQDWADVAKLDKIKALEKRSPGEHK
jgi:hypothetical protein